MKFFWLVSFLCLTLFTQASEAREKISLQLSWLSQFQSAGFYIALHKGFYQEENLDVTIKEYANGTDIIDDVIAQKSTYGVGKSSLIIDKHHPQELALLLALFQSAPSVLITTDPEIKTLKDLRGKRVMITSDEASSASIMAMLMSQGVLREDIIRQQHSFILKDLVDRKTDAMACYVSNEPFALSKQGITYTLFNPKDYGFDFYGDILFTSQKEIKQNPERVKRFYQATKKGWEWAFAHIEESAKIMHQHYNSQNKTLESLVFEGNALKELAYTKENKFGTIDKQKFQNIANIYRLSGLLNKAYCLDDFIDPLHLAKEIVRIGVLANNGDDIAKKMWQESAEYLTTKLPHYNFQIIPLNFKELAISVKNKALDFVITNPMYYVQLEHDYGISRIATLSNHLNNQDYHEFGSTILTLSENKTMKDFTSLKGKRLGAVDENSLGGYLMSLKELKDHGIESTHFSQISFFGTHNGVIKALLDKKIDVGIVRTGTLESLEEEGKIKRTLFQIIGDKKHPNFPFALSTTLYPEWPFAKLEHTQEFLSNAVLSALIHPDFHTTDGHSHFDWNTPADYTPIRVLLKEMQIYPYKPEPITFKDVIQHYAAAFILGFFFILFLLFLLVHIKNLNKRLLHHTQEIEHFNTTLEKEVADRTHQLTLLNSKLKELANTDELTKIDNRRHFIELATTYFYAAKRNHTELFILSMDIDFFKNVNDTYGHAIGDEVLKLICQTTKKILRESDLFGRIGGEEFSICIQNTTFEGALTLAEKIRAKIEQTYYEKSAHEHIYVTISIGIASLEPEDTDIYRIMERADKALYKAKENGRNQVQVI